MKLLNERVDAARLGQLLMRVILRLGERGGSGRPLSSDEEERLSAALGLEGSQVSRVVETCSYVFEQAAYWGASSAALQADLQRVQLSTPLAQAFAAVWDAQGPTLRAALAQKSVCAERLEETQWQLQMQLGSQSASRIKQPQILLSLATSNQDKGGEKQVHTLAFTQDELIKFSLQRKKFIHA